MNGAVDGRTQFASLLSAAAVVAATVVAYALAEQRRVGLRPVRELGGSRADLAARVLAGGGLAPSLRQRAWPTLLRLPGGEEVAASHEKLLARVASLRDDPTDTAFAEAIRIVGVDVPRTTLQAGATRSAAEPRLSRLLLCYAAHDGDVGYSQGMSDVAAVFISVFEEEALCSAAFNAFVFRHRTSFARDTTRGLGVRLRALGALLATADPAVGAHLVKLRATECVWALRPVVVLLARELGSHRVAPLWDVLMAHEHDDYILYVVAAALLSHRRRLLRARGMDDLLLLVNSLGAGMRLGRVLADARTLYRKCVRRPPPCGAPSFLLTPHHAAAARQGGCIVRSVSLKTEGMRRNQMKGKI